MSAKRATDPGFTLLETLLALILAAAGLIALGGLLVRTGRSHEQSRENMRYLVERQEALAVLRPAVAGIMLPPGGSERNLVRCFGPTLTVDSPEPGYWDFRIEDGRLALRKQGRLVYLSGLRCTGIERWQPEGSGLLGLVVAVERPGKPDDALYLAFGSTCLAESP